MLSLTTAAGIVIETRFALQAAIFDWEVIARKLHRMTRCDIVHHIVEGTPYMCY